MRRNPTASEATGDVRIRVLIVDDEPLARDRMRQLLEAEPDIEIVGECDSGQDAVEVIERAGPDLVLPRRADARDGRVHRA